MPVQLAESPELLEKGTGRVIKIGTINTAGREIGNDEQSSVFTREPV